jgi:hypothetical protein
VNGQRFRLPGRVRVVIRREREFGGGPAGEDDKAHASNDDGGARSLGVR